MFKKNSKYINVADFSPKLSMIIQNEKIVNIINDNFIQVEKARSIFNLYDDILILDSLNKPSIIKKNEVDLSLKEKFRVSSLSGHLIIFYKKEEERLYGIYDYKLRKILFETRDWIGRNIFGNHIFSNFKNLVSCRNVYNGTQVWQLNISQYGTCFKIGHGKKEIELDRFLGVFENQLLIFLTDNSLLSIDVQTGKENYRKHIKNPFSEDQLHYPLWPTYWKFYKNKLIFYRWGWYIEYDLKTKKINTKFNINESLKTDKLYDNAPNWIKEGNLLYYFITGFGSFSLPALVILDIETQQVIWKEIYNNPNVSYKILKKNDKNLFVLDSEKTLHVFEKQDFSASASVPSVTI